jgi:hypothetical protein
MSEASVASVRKRKPLKTLDQFFDLAVTPKKMCKHSVDAKAAASSGASQPRTAASTAPTIVSDATDEQGSVNGNNTLHVPEPMEQTPLLSKTNTDSDSIFADLLKEVEMTSTEGPHMTGGGESYELTKENLQILESEMGETLDKVEKERPDGKDALPARDKKMMQALQEQNETGLQTRSYLGQLFREQNGQNDAYRMLGSEQQQAFRNDWVAKKYESFKKEKMFKQRWQRLDYEKAEYVNIGQLIIGEGGWNDRSAVIGAVRAAKRCMLLGYPWVRKDPQTQRTVYARLKLGWEESFEESWSAWTTEYKTGTRVADEKKTGELGVPVADGSADIQAIGDEAPDAADGKDDKRKTAKPKATPKVKSAPGAEATAQRKQVTKAITEATRTKARFLGLTSSVVELVEQMEKDPAWSWANNDANKGTLLRACHALREPLTDFHKRVLTEDISAVKKTVTTEFLIVQLGDFVKIKTRLDELGKLIAQLLKRHGV